MRLIPRIGNRKLAKVPFVELADGRLQGIVSSGSDAKRVYVSFITAGSFGSGCSTNNDRSCSGFGGTRCCKHLTTLLTEAISQFGISRVRDFLEIEQTEEIDDVAGFLRCMSISKSSAPTATVFNRYLSHLQYLEIPTSTNPIPELQWFSATGAA